LVRHVNQVHPRHALEDLAREVRRAAVPRRRKLSLPGRALAYAISSETELTGTDGCTTTKCGTEAASVIGAKSLATSYWRLGKRLGAIAFTDTWPIMIV